jgi:hypothetical protein
MIAMSMKTPYTNTPTNSRPNSRTVYSFATLQNTMFVSVHDVSSFLHASIELQEYDTGVTGKVKLP